MASDDPARRPVDGAQRQGVGLPDRRDVEAEQRPDRRRALPDRRRDHVDLLRRAARPVAALRRSSTSPPRATSRPPARSSAWSAPAAARRTSASSAARSGCPIELAQRLGKRVVLGQPVRRLVTQKGSAHRDHRRLPREGQARDRRDPAAAGRAHRLPPEAARAARPAHPAHADGHGDEGARRLRPSRSGATRPHRPGGGRHRARAGDVRQHAALGHARASSWPSSRRRPRASASAHRATRCAATC